MMNGNLSLSCQWLIAQMVEWSEVQTPLQVQPCEFLLHLIATQVNGGSIVGINK